MCVCVCCTHLFSFFPLAFVLVNDLSLASRCFCFGNAYDFVFVFVAVCFFLLYALCIICLLPCLTRCSFIDVLSCTPTGVSEINHLTWVVEQGWLEGGGTERDEGGGRKGEVQKGMREVVGRGRYRKG